MDSEPQDSPADAGFLIGQTRMPARRLEAGLYVVSTPIGNLGDVTIRALEALAAADILLCEDTRVTRVLLERFAIRRRMTAYHEHNETEATPALVEAIQAGKSVALVSDAGTPLVSDPGYRLVSAAAEADLPVVAVPGASALLAALAVSGLPSDSFFFAGFLPAKAGKRETRLRELAAIPGTLIFYESPRRLADVVPAMAEVLGGARQATISRELTKRFEEVRRGSLSELATLYAGSEAPKGEAVICVGPPSGTEARPEDMDALLLDLVARMPASKAASEASRQTGQPRGDLYARLLELKGR